MNCDCGAKELADGSPAVTRDSATTYTRHTAERCEPGSGLWNVLRDTRMPGCGEPLLEVDLRPGAINRVGPPPPEPPPLTRWQRLRDRIADRVQAVADRIRWSDT